MSRSKYDSSTPLILGCSLLLAMVAVARGQGGPPLIGDDPGTPGANNWEINIAYTGLRTPHLRQMETPHLDFNYGLGERIQLKCEVGLSLGRDDHRGWQTGVNNSILGFKYRFLDEEKNGIAMSIYPQPEFNTSRASVRERLANGGTNLLLPIEVAKTFGPWEVDAEFGYEFIQHDRDQWVAGPIIGYRLTKRIELLAEARGVFDQDFRRNNLILDAGTRVDIIDGIQFLFAAGRSVRSTGDSPRFLVYTGLRFNF